MEQSKTGPYLQAAFFCERLLEEADGVLSAIRIVDEVILQGDAPVSPTEPPVMSLTLFIALKAGKTRGHYDLSVAMEPPTGNGDQRDERYSQSIHFYGTEDQGVTVVMPVAMTLSEEGVYWFGVYLGERLITRVPLRVAVLREMPPTDPQ